VTGTIPSGGYPKMVTASDGRRTVPLVWPAGDVKQFTPVILNNAAEEAAYTGNGVAITSTHGTGTPDSWSSGWKNTSGSGGSGNR
jgi:hypothetical protein